MLGVRCLRGGGSLLRQNSATVGGSTGDTGGGNSAVFSTFNIRPIGVAWKESTSNGPRPPSPIIAPWRRHCAIICCGGEENLTLDYGQLRLRIDNPGLSQHYSSAISIL